jgi:hypothetical protein
MMIPGGDRNMLEWLTDTVIYIKKDKKSGFLG